jgi:hypothetical protein
MVIVISGCNLYKQPIPQSANYSYYESSVLGEEVADNSYSQYNSNSYPTTDSNPVVTVEKEVPKVTTPPTQEKRVKKVKEKREPKEPKEQISRVSKDKIKSIDKTVIQRIPFPENEYKSLPKTGKATIAGKIYLVTPSGDKIYGSKARLYLNPVTSYSTQWYKESYLGGAKMSKVDPRLFNYIRFSASDDNGDFEFLNVPSGSYYLIGIIECSKECGFKNKKIIRVVEKVSVLGNEIKNIELSKRL